MHYTSAGMSHRQKAQSANLRKIQGQNRLGANNEKHLGFGQLSESVIESLPIGVVAFDPNLKIIEANTQAVEFIELGDYIDKSVLRGTDNQIWKNWTEHLGEAIQTGKTSRLDKLSYTLNGRTKLLRIFCSPLKQAQTQQNIGGIVVIEDITEKANIQRELAETERLAAVGKLASKVAHELNNPMDGILRYINLAMRILEQEHLAKPKDYLQQCRKGLMRMVQIISELLEFSRTTHSTFEYTEINKIVEDAVKMMESTATASTVQIFRDYGTEMPQIRSGNLFQVFCNLIKNAIDAMPQGGKLTITTRQPANDTISIEFQDTGFGFQPENSQAIFEPFFTTKGRSKGTGLGLAICKDIIDKYNGRITAENAPQGGSIFTVYLPVTDESQTEISK